jgi:hypothetical protein
VPDRHGRAGDGREVLDWVSHAHQFPATGGCRGQAAGRGAFSDDGVRRSVGSSPRGFRALAERLRPCMAFRSLYPWTSGQRLPTRFAVVDTSGTSPAID